jgi:hypothetical protein
MKRIFKKLFIPGGQLTELKSYESWVVRWESRWGDGMFCTQPEAEVFTTEEDAKKFAESLRSAFKLIRHTDGTEVKVTKNKIN